MMITASKLYLPAWLARLCLRASIEKGIGHKYVRREPTGNPKKPWRYFYNLTSGRGHLDTSRIREGAKFKIADGHVHVTSVDGEHAEVTHDETGETARMHVADLADLLHSHHGEEIERVSQRQQKFALNRQRRVAEKRSRRAFNLPRSDRAISTMLEEEIAHDFGTIDMDDQRVRDKIESIFPKRQATKIKHFHDLVTALVQQARKNNEVKTWADLRDARLGGRRAGTDTVFDVIREIGDEIDDEKLKRATIPAEAQDEILRRDEEAHYRELYGEDGGDERDTAEPEDGGDTSFDPEMFKSFRIPSWLAKALESVVAKAAGHKYLRRIPTGNPKRPWRYYYRVTGGKHLAHDDEIVEGAAFRAKDGEQEGHFHVVGVDGENVRVRHDETGREATMKREALRAMLHAEHVEKINAAVKWATETRDAAEKHGSEKQKARARKHAEGVVGAFVKPEPKAEAPAAAPEKKARKPRAKAAPKPEDATPALDVDGKLTAVGEHVWGSRKDLATVGRIESSKDLESMSYADAAAIVTKARILEPLTLEQAKGLGMSPGVAHLGLAMLAAIRSKPDDTAASRAAYVDDVRAVQGVLKNVKTLDEFDRAIGELNRRHRSAPGYTVVEMVPGEYYSYDRAKAQARAYELTGETGVRHVVRVGLTGGPFIARDAPKPFDSLGRAFLAFISRKRDAKTWNEAYTRALTLDDKWDYNQGQRMTPDQAWAWLESSQKPATPEPAKGAKPKVDAGAKGQTKRGWSGAKDFAGDVRRRGGKVSVEGADPKRTADTFGLREIDYGREGYMSQGDREYHTKALEEALHDFTEILGIDPKQVSFKGRLGIALGADGRGGTARAHYESGRRQINITKFAGGGSLAHEWGHAMDNIIASHYIENTSGSAEGSFMSTAQKRALPDDLRGAVEEAMKAILEHPEPEKAKAAHAARSRELYAEYEKLVSTNNALVREADALSSKPPSRENANRRLAKLEETNARYRTEADEIRARARGSLSGAATQRLANLEWWAKGNEKKIAELRKPDAIQTPEDAKRIEAIKAEVEDYRLKINRAMKAWKTHDAQDSGVSDFAMSGALLGPYWGSTVELFARAFESYVQDKLEDAGRSNSYLVAGTRAQYMTAIPHPNGGDAQPYPQGEERKRINAAMEKLVRTVHQGKHIEKALAALEDLEKAMEVTSTFARIPSRLGAKLWKALGGDIEKAAGHKYLRRVATGNPKRPWRYYYRVTGGKQLGHEDEFTEGAMFRVKDAGEDGHFRIRKVEGGTLYIGHDESGRLEKISKTKFAELLRNEHVEKIQAARASAERIAAEAAQYGSEKQKQKTRAYAEKLRDAFSTPEEKAADEKRRREAEEAAKPKRKRKPRAEGGDASSGVRGAVRRRSGVPGPDDAPASGGAPVEAPTVQELIEAPTPEIGPAPIPDAAPFTTMKSPAIRLHEDLLPERTVTLPDDVRVFKNPTGKARELFDHQVDGAERMLTAWAYHDGFILQDEAGLGKTNTALAAIIANKGKRNLIVVPEAGKANLINQWQESAKLFGAEIQRGGQTSGTCVVSYNELYDVEEVTEVVDGTPKTKKVKRLAKALQGSWDTITFDESHNMTNADSAFAAFGKVLQRSAKKVAYLSATPYTNIADMHYLTKLGLFDDDRESFAKWAEYAGAIVEGGGRTGYTIKNPPTPLPMAAVAATLHVDGQSLKRITSLEGVSSQFAEVKIDSLDEGSRRSLREGVSILEDAVKNNVVEQSIANAFFAGWARQYWETLKVDQAIELGKKAIDEGRQVAFYTSFKAANHAHLRALAAIAIRKADSIQDERGSKDAARLRAFAEETIKRIEALPPVESAIKKLVDAFGGSKQVAEIHGDTSKKPEAEQAAYQAGKKRVVVATMSRGGTGISLHDDQGIAPRTQINLSLPWSGREFLQVAGRSHRLGSKSNTVMHWLVGEHVNERNNAAKVAERLKSMGSLTSGDPEATADATTLSAWSSSSGIEAEDVDEAVRILTAAAEDNLSDVDAAKRAEAQAARDYFREFAEQRKGGRNVLEDRYLERKAAEQARQRLEARRAAEQLKAELPRSFQFAWDDESKHGYVRLVGWDLGHAKKLEKLSVGRGKYNKESHPDLGPAYKIPYSAFPKLAEKFDAHTRKIDMREVAAREKAEAAAAEEAKKEAAKKAAEQGAAAADGLAFLNTARAKLRNMGNGIHVSPGPASRPGWFILTGDTFEQREKIKRLAGPGEWTFNPGWGSKAWYVTEQGLRGLAGIEKALDAEENETMDTIEKSDMLYSGEKLSWWMRKYAGTPFLAQALKIERESMEEIAALTDTFTNGNATEIASASLKRSEITAKYQAAKDALAIRYVKFLEEQAEANGGQIPGVTGGMEKALKDDDAPPAPKVPARPNVVPVPKVADIAIGMLRDRLQHAQQYDAGRRALELSQRPRQPSPRRGV